ncbi:MAG TPA: hypothetical protein DD391_00345 [Clostridiales bacterium]|nr:hypothetical protein [Clostridiales bacterium]HBL81060.1 hypothetical protein [Clostridiales bacterium]
MEKVAKRGRTLNVNINQGKQCFYTIFYERQNTLPLQSTAFAYFLQLFYTSNLLIFTKLKDNDIVTEALLQIT